MAFRTLIRRALPLATRAVASPRAYHRASISSVQKRCLCRRVCLCGVHSPRTGAPFVSFSTKPSSDAKLLEILESEIDCADQPDEKILQHKPKSFPFEIQDNQGERTIFLTREYGDEVIKVEVDIPTFSEDGDDESEDGEKKDEEKDQNDSSIPMVVSISKGRGPHLEFGVTAFPDEIVIDAFSIKHAEDGDEQLPYEGPNFEDLDENLQKALREYLEVRGINRSTAAYLLGYMNNKDAKEYLVWLENLEKFIKK